MGWEPLGIAACVHTLKCLERPGEARKREARMYLLTHCTPCGPRQNLAAHPVPFRSLLILIVRGATARQQLMLLAIEPQHFIVLESTGPVQSTPFTNDREFNFRNAMATATREIARTTTTCALCSQHGTHTRAARQPTLNAHAELLHVNQVVTEFIRSSLLLIDSDIGMGGWEPLGTAECVHTLTRLERRAKRET